MSSSSLLSSGSIDRDFNEICHLYPEAMSKCYVNIDQSDPYSSSRITKSAGRMEHLGENLEEERVSLGESASSSSATSPRNEPIINWPALEPQAAKRKLGIRTKRASTRKPAKKTPIGEGPSTPAPPRNLTPSIGDIVSKVDRVDLEFERVVNPWMWHVDIMMPYKTQRVHTPPSGWFNIYLDQVAFGFIYPLPAGICDLLNR